MLRFRALSHSFGILLNKCSRRRQEADCCGQVTSASLRRRLQHFWSAPVLWLVFLPVWLQPGRAGAVVLWSDSTARLVHENGAGADILAGAVKRDDSANDTLYFKFHVDPLSDNTTEEYFASLELFDGDIERLGVGNALKAWA